MNEAKLRWLPFELHTHTFHSDGKQSLMELAEGARALGLSGVALTDHNTMTGLAESEQVSGQTGVEIIPGLEWTTFFGHMVTLGIKEYVDWRNLSPFHIHRGIEDVHRQGGLAGIAHPFRVGSPMCTGCFWEFEVSDWRQIDYIEVWSGLFPSIQRNNARAFGIWTDLLNRGFRISATCGRDWHVSGPVSEPVAATFLGLSAQETEEATASWRDAAEGKPQASDADAAAKPLSRADGAETKPLPTVDGASAQPYRLADAALNALRRGAVSVSMGPLPLISVQAEDGRRLAGIGEIAGIPQSGPQKTVRAGLAVDFSARDGQWELPKKSVELRINSSRGVLASSELSRDRPEAECPIDTNGVTWIRGEMYGVIHRVHTMIGFTNPIYFEFN